MTCSAEPHGVSYTVSAETIWNRKKQAIAKQHKDPVKAPGAEQDKTPLHKQKFGKIGISWALNYTLKIIWKWVWLIFLEQAIKTIQTWVVPQSEDMACWFHQIFEYLHRLACWSPGMPNERLRNTLEVSLQTSTNWFHQFHLKIHKQRCLLHKLGVIVLRVHVVKANCVGTLKPQHTSPTSMFQNSAHSISFPSCQPRSAIASRSTP